MQKDFHFYLIAAILKDAGYSKEQRDIVSYASQYVDDNNEYQLIDGVPFDNRITANGQCFRGIISHTFSLKTFTSELQNYVLMPFHFLPANNPNPDIRKDGKSNKYSTRPANESMIADTLFDEVLKTENMYALGIVLHAVADSFSHQNFSGMDDDWNSVYPWFSPYSVAPNIGHAEVGQNPDTLSDDWSDKRLPKEEQKIVNRKRALQAAEYIYKKLFQHKHPDREDNWDDLSESYRDLIEGPAVQQNDYDYDDRVEAVKNYLDEPDLHYDRQKWLREAVELDKEQSEFKARSAHNFIRTDYWQFQLAAQMQVASVWRLMARAGL